MKVNQLRIFHAVGKSLSFTGASQELNLTQPGISKQIKELEEYYGTRLFDRLGKKIALTRAGEILLQTTTEIFSLLAESKSRIDDLNGLVGGRVSIGASITIGAYLLPATLVQFRRQYPGIEIKVATARSREIADQVLNNTLEVGLVGHCAPDDRLIIQSFMIDRMILIVSARHRWVGRKSPVRLQELAKQPFLVSKPGSGTWRTVGDFLAREHVILHNSMEMGTTEAVKQGVEADLGISIVASHVVSKELASGVIKAIPVAGMELKRDLYLVYHKDKYLSEAARAFIRLCPT
jgi:DNA-binding transcriptional LysR family regulator